MNDVTPPLRELGLDLLRVTRFQRTTALAAPFLYFAAYFACAAAGWWVPAVLATVALSFFTYGSTSHDLVHRTLGLSHRANEVLLCLTELLALRSGHAYRLAHLHHHAKFPADDDIEAAASRMSWVAALASGFTFQVRVWLWAYRRGINRAWVVGEGVACVSLLAASVGLAVVTPVFAVYAGLMVAGSWVIPFATSYLQHDPAGASALTQTRAFRGKVASAVALGHLYHLEHHLYPAVPHQNWGELARRLDPYLERAGVKPVTLWR
ncbi:MAG: fatty acid desaturase [Planctomycetes bacterium]|nr:fatty acid desaturase [Planctomycetota bacterium]